MPAFQIMKTTRTPIRTVDRDGAEIVLVPLANHHLPAKLLADDFDRLVSDGVSLAWTFNDNGSGYGYVRTYSGAVAGKLTSIARLIVNAGRGKVVKYRDGDRLNLRRDNLWIARGPARGQTPSDAVLRKQQQARNRTFQAFLREAEARWGD